MTIAGGTPTYVSFAGKEFVLTGDAKPEFDDGIVINPTANADGSLRELHEIGAGMITGVVVEADAAKYEQLIEFKNTVGGKDMSIELIDGTKYVVSDGAKPINLKYNPADATCSFDIAGSRPGRNRAWLKRV
jgi:hypothetical protein